MLSRIHGIRQIKEGTLHTCVRTNNEAFTIVAGRPVKFDSTGCKLAQADDIANIAVGIAYNTAAMGTDVTIVLMGILSVADWTVASGGSATLTSNSYYYLSQGAAGILTTIPPSSTGQIYQPLGMAVTTTDFFVQVQTAIIV